MQTGWVKLHRKSIDSRVFSDAELWKLWTWALMRANHADRYFEGELIPRGSFVTGSRSAAAALGGSSATIHRRLKKLAEWKMINLKVRRGFTIVTICNFEVYNGDESADETQMKRERNADETQMKHARNADETPMKPNKNYQELQEPRELPRTPPTPEGEEPPKPKRSKIENLAMALPPLAEFPEPIRFDRCRMAWQSWLAYKAKNKPYRTVEGHRKQLAEAGAKGPESFLGAIALALRKEWQGPNLRAFLEMRAEGKINADGSENLEVFSGGNNKRSGGDRLGPGQRFAGEPAEVASVRGW